MIGLCGKPAIKAACGKLTSLALTPKIPFAASCTPAIFCPLLFRPNGETFRYIEIISFLEKCFSTCAANKISFAFRLNVVSSVKICCLTNC